MARQSTHQTKPNPEKTPRRDPTASGQRDAAVNRIASHNYFLLEKFEVGVALTGTEVKSVRGGLANLKDSYGLIKDGELWLLNAHIGPYEHGNIHNHAPLRTRKLLMHREEIRKLIGKTQQKGLTLIPVPPAWHFGAAEPGETLKDRGRSSAGTKRQRLRSALVVANVAIALVLLLGAGLLLRSLGRLLNVDAGFDASNVLTANLDVGGPNYRKDPQIVAFYQQVLERIRALPGVESVGMTSQLPLGGNVDGYGVHVEGKLSPNPQNDPSADRYSVSPDYLHTMRIPVISGRAFTDADRADTQSVVLVNQTLARRMWPGEDPLGKRVKVGGLDGPWRIVVGVVGDVLHGGLDASHTNQIYLPESQFTDGTVVLVIRTAASSVNSEAAVRRAVAEVDRNQPTSKFATMDQVVLRSLAQRSFTLGLLGGFAGLALLLAAVGIYGVISYLVSLRRHEIGIRMALGASPANVQQMVLRHGLRLGAIGIGLGLATGLGAGRALSSLLFQVSPTDPLAMAGGALLLLAMALLASYIPARRAAQLDPMAALRHE